MVLLGRWRRTAVYRSTALPPAVDPWAVYPLFELTFADRLVAMGEAAFAAQARERRR